jgi:UPF0716 protein FxsA
MVAVLRAFSIVVPLAEILILIVVADQIGIGWTLLALAVSALAGVIVIRVLGAASLAELRAALARREPPAGALVRGACVLLAGMLLILPGFLSDVVALLLLLPPTRAALVGTLWRRRRDAGARRKDGAMVIDGEYREVPPEPPSRLDDGRLDDGRLDDGHLDHGSGEPPDRRR